MATSKTPTAPSDLQSLLIVLKKLEKKYNNVEKPDQLIVQLISDSKKAVMKIQDEKNYDDAKFDEITIGSFHINSTNFLRVVLRIGQNLVYC